MAYELALLKQKLAIRDASRCAELGKVNELQPHPIFEVVQIEPVVWGGPIVMNTQAELDLAFHEYKNGTFIKNRS